MNKVEKIGIASIGPFKKGASLPIVPGVSFLYGKNELNGGNANAVGKSLMGKVIQDIFYEPEVRGDKPKTGKRVVVFSQGKKQIKIVSEINKTEKVQIEVDGEDKSARTSSQTKKAAQELWGVTQDEFLTYGLVDAAVPHPLVKGGTAARKAFFTSFFGLDRMDAEKKIFLKELAEVKRAKAAYEELEKAFASARKDMLSKEERIDLQEKLDVLNKKLKKLSMLQEQAIANQRLDAFKEVAGAKLKQLDKVTRSLAEVKKDWRAANEAQDQLAEYKEYKRALDKYNMATADLDMDVSLTELVNASVAYDRTVASLADVSGLRKPTFTDEEPEQPKTTRAELEATQRRLKHSLEHSRKFAKGVCDTCGQEVKAKDPAKLKKELVAVERDLEAWEQLQDYRERKKKHEADLATYKELISEKRELEAALPALKAKAALFKKRKGLVKPVKVEKPARLWDLEALRVELDLTKFAEENEDTIEALKTYVPVSFDNSKYAALQERVFAMRAKLDLHESVKKRASEIKSRLDDLGKAIRKQQELEIILEGYSDKAMKKMAIQAISQHLMTSVNKYAALVFENYSFEFVWGTQIQLIVHRPEGSSDVRRLSGAESMLFTIILILSLLIFVPKSKRLSLLVLDEPYASFSDGTAELFTKLLPHLTQVIPSVLIITPKSEFRVEGATEFTAVKQASGTAIRKGHPDEI